MSSSSTVFQTADINEQCNDLIDGITGLPCLNDDYNNNDSGIMNLLDALDTLDKETTVPNPKTSTRCQPCHYCTLLIAQ